MEQNYLLDGNFRKILLRLIDNPFDKTKLTELSDLVPFESMTGEEIFIEDNRCFVRHNINYVTYFYVENDEIDNYELIKRIVMKYNIYLNGQDERSKNNYIEEIKMLLSKTK